MGAAAGDAFSVVGFVLGANSSRGIEEGLEDSASLSGKGNSRGGGIGRMLARGPLSSEGSVGSEVDSIIDRQSSFENDDCQQEQKGVIKTQY